MFVCARAPAKINLTLSVTGKLSDGYHLIHTVMQAVTLYETVKLSKTGEAGVKLTVTGIDIAPGQCTTVFRAADAFFGKTGIGRFGLDIHLDKRVPPGAGLAGASADAAAVLTALNKISQTGLSKAELCEIGAAVGSDVPFCIIGGAAVGTGTGTTLMALPPLPDCALLIAKPSLSISTGEAYALIDRHGFKREYAGDDMINALRDRDILSAARLLCNDFEAVAGLPEIDEIKSIMRCHRALGCQMTGSGSAVFGIFSCRDTAGECFDSLKKKYDHVFLCRPCIDGASLCM